MMATVKAAAKMMILGAAFGQPVRSGHFLLLFLPARELALYPGTTTPHLNVPAVVNASDSDDLLVCERQTHFMSENILKDGFDLGFLLVCGR